MTLPTREQLLSDAQNALKEARDAAGYGDWVCADYWNALSRNYMLMATCLPPDPEQLKEAARIHADEVLRVTTNAKEAFEKIFTTTAVRVYEYLERLANEGDEDAKALIDAIEGKTE